MEKYLRTSFCVIVLMTLANVATARQNKATSKPKPISVTVKEVSGTAQRLLAGKDKKWAPLKAGEKIDEMTVIRTGFRTKVVLVFADNSVVTIQRATKMGIGEFRKEGKVTKTRLGLKYGSIRAKVKKAGGPNDFQISTPVATAAARGSESLTIYSPDFGHEGKSFSGKWRHKKGFKVQNISGTEMTNNKLEKPINVTKRIFTPVVRDLYGGLSKKELKYSRRQSTGRAVLSSSPGDNKIKRIINRPAPWRRKVIKSTPRPISPIVTPNLRVPGLDEGN